MTLVPMVVKEGPRGERAYDIYSLLMEERVVILNGKVDAGSAGVIQAQLLYLESDSPKKPIKFYINSGGGSIVHGMAIYDTMQYIRSPVHTICTGMAASMASFLLCAGEPGHRYITANAEVMIHQPLAGYEGQEKDIRIHADHLTKTRQKLEKLYAYHLSVPKTLEEIHNACDRDNYMTAEEAQKWGLVDNVITKRPIEDDEE